MGHLKKMVSRPRLSIVIKDNTRSIREINWVIKEEKRKDKQGESYYQRLKKEQEAKGESRNIITPKPISSGGLPKGKWLGNDRELEMEATKNITADYEK